MLNSNIMADYLQRFPELSLDDLYRLFSLASERQLKAGDTYIAAGTASQRLAYIKTGLIRAYEITDRGEEKTLLLKWENQFFASFDTILHHRPSRFTYEALEDTILLEADHAAFMQVIDADPRFAKAKTYFLQHMLAEALERLESFVLLTPEERYVQLIHEKPGLAQRVAARHIATLLGITPVSLSRIRRRLAQGK
jgi:CRP-like cAMP-binding protein